MYLSGWCIHDFTAGGKLHQLNIAGVGEQGAVDKKVLGGRRAALELLVGLEESVHSDLPNAQQIRFDWSTFSGAAARDPVR
jgi:hypothetical protein